MLVKTVIDLRTNNAKIPQFEEFWSIAAEFIEDKTAVSDGRHNSSDDQGDIVVYMAMANSYADMYRQCVVAKALKDEIAVTSLCVVLQQFWPTTKTASNILHYTGRFKIKRMVQARILCKYNPDSHYTNAIYSFMRKKKLHNADA